MTIQFNGKEIAAFHRKIEATCLVRTRENGEREADQIVKTLGQTTPRGLPYDPRPFPPGTWEITRVADMGDDTEYAPVFIDTGATQILNAWELDEEGDYLRATKQRFIGRGYGIHHARWNPGGGLVPSRTTLGCLNIIEPDNAAWLGRKVREAWEMGIVEIIGGQDDK